MPKFYITSFWFLQEFCCQIFWKLFVQKQKWLICFELSKKHDTLPTGELLGHKLWKTAFEIKTKLLEKVLSSIKFQDHFEKI